jgi:hypothetical protein
MIARSVYFLPTGQDSIPVQVKSFTKRLWLRYANTESILYHASHRYFSDVAIHIEVAVLLSLAFITTVVQLLHRDSRKDLRFRHQPGTIASAVSIGAQTDLANLLHGQQEQNDLIKALRNKKFRINPLTMKILTEGESGYEQAASPNPRQSIFGALGLGARGNKHFSSIVDKLTPPSSGRGI